MNIGKTKVIVKPAMVVLVGAILTGLVSASVLLRERGPEVPSFGLVNPETWRFDTRHGAQALAFGAESGTGGTSDGVVDAGEGFRVRVDKTGTAADAVYLRNALNLDLNPARKPLRVTFEARATGSGGAFPLTFTVRDSATLLWSDKVGVGSSWQKFERPMSLQQSTFQHVIMAVHLGEVGGEVEIRNLRVTF